MFYPVRILDSKNKLKKIIPVRELKIKHWAEYEKKQEAYASTRIKKTQNIEKMRLWKFWLRVQQDLIESHKLDNT